MMAKINAIFVIAALSRISQASGNEASSISSASVYSKVRYHVRDIVGMLQSMQEQVRKDGDEDAELFGKYMFYCRRGREAMEEAIEDAEKTDLDALQVGIDGEEESKEDLLNDIHDDEVKKLDADKAIKTAKALRAYEAATYDDESAKLRNDLGGLKHASAALAKGEGLDAAGTSVLKQLSGSHDIKKSDRETLAALLEQVHSGSNPSQQEMQKAVSHMTEVLKDKLSTVVEDERARKESFQDYKNMIKEKASALKVDMEQKASEVEELQQDVGVQKDALEDASRYLMEGPAFLPFVGEGNNCSQREDDWADRCEVRTSELGTCAEAISILTEDSYLEELRQKLTPDPWQSQLPPSLHPAFLAANEHSEKPHVPFDIVQLALQGKNASFTKIFNVFDGMVAMLGKEAKVNTEKYCGQSLDQTEDNLKKLSLTVSELATMIAQHEKSVESLTAEINEVQAGSKKLDMEIMNAAKLRKQEHNENAEFLTIKGIAVHLFETVRDKLHAFYSQEITLDADSSGKATLGDIIGPYHIKREESTTIIEMLNATLGELFTEFADVEMKERHHQQEWEKAARESTERHYRDMKSIADKEEAKTALEAALVTEVQEKKDKMHEVKASTKYLSELKGNNTGFLRPAVCSRKPTLPKDKDIEPGLLTKKLQIWT